jgi:hypothetical protein
MLAGNTTSLFGGGVSLGNDAYTKLLLHFTGPVGSKKFLDYSPAMHGLGTPAGNAQIVSPSGMFASDGATVMNNDSYITFPNSSDWEFQAGDFTVDWWEFRGAAGCIIARDIPTSICPWLFGYNTGTGNKIFISSNGTSFDMANNLGMGANIGNTWTHYAVCRKAGTLFAFQNGTLQGTWPISGSIFPNSNPLGIGAAQGANNYSGYIDEIRVSKGICRWTQNFSPANVKPYGPDAPYSFTKLLLHMDGANGSTTIPDSSPWQQGSAGISGNAKLSTVQSKFGGASLALAGGPDYIAYVDAPDFNPGASDFTVDFWARVAATGVQYSLFGKNNGSLTNGYGLYVNTSGTVQGFWLPSDSAFTGIQSAVLVSNTNWHHYAYQRYGSAMQIYFDGTLAVQGSISASASITTAADVFSIGQLGTFTPINLNGNVDEFRLTKGRAVFTGNFTPPSAPYVY